MSKTIFQKIIDREIPAKIEYEDSDYVAIHDIAPQAPVHLLIIPKRVIPTLNDVRKGDEALVGGMLRIASEVMQKLGHSDYRAVYNCGSGAGQTVWHLHLHVLAGRKLSWPPG
jgi:histidine triad (HIT) family protein